MLLIRKQIPKNINEGIKEQQAQYKEWVNLELEDLELEEKEDEEEKDKKKLSLLNLKEVYEILKFRLGCIVGFVKFPSEQKEDKGSKLKQENKEESVTELDELIELVFKKKQAIREKNTKKPKSLSLTKENKEPKTHLGRSF